MVAVSICTLGCTTPHFTFLSKSIQPHALLDHQTRTTHKIKINLRHSRVTCDLKIAWQGNTGYGSIALTTSHPPVWGNTPCSWLRNVAWYLPYTKLWH